MRENISSLRLTSKFSPRDWFLSISLRYVAFVGLHHGWIIFKANSRIRQLRFVFSLTDLFAWYCVMYAQSCFFRETSHSFFCFSVGRPLVHPRELRGSSTVLVFLFSPRGRRVAKSWKRLHWTGDIPTGYLFVRGLVSGMGKQMIIVYRRRWVGACNSTTFLSRRFHRPIYF